MLWFSFEKYFMKTITVTSVWFHGFFCKKLARVNFRIFSQCVLHYFLQCNLVEEKMLVSRNFSLEIMRVNSWNFHTVHYAPETFKMWSSGLTLLKFYHYSDFTWNQSLLNSNSPNMSYWQFWILQSLTLGKFGTWKLLKFT